MESTKKHPIFYLIKSNQLNELDETLQNKQDLILEREDEYENTPLHVAVLYGNTEAAEILLKYYKTIDIRNKNGNTPLHLSCEKGYLKMTRLLINKGADVNLANKSGFYPLHMAIFFKNPKTAMAVIDAGADLYAESKSERYPTPLSLAVKEEEQEIIDYLRNRGVRH